MDVGRVRAAGASLVTLALLGLGATPALAASGVSVSALSSLKAGTTAGTLSGAVVNDSGHATRSEVAVRIMRRGTHAPVVGRTTVKVAAHGSAAYRVAVKLPAGLKQGNYYLSACTPNGKGAGALGCATARDDVLIKGGIPVRGVQAAGKPAAKAAQAPACSAGGRTLVHPGSRLYPETGNTGYTSIHSDVNLVYDAPSNLFLPGTHVDLQQRATQCLTEFSLDFERSNAVTSTTVPGPDLTVQSITIDGQPATFTFKQPTYPGDPNGQDDPDPLAHAASNSNPVSATNPNPPACAPISNAAAEQGLPCPATKLVITPAAPIAAGSDFKVVVNYTGRPGVHVDGDGATEGWFRNNTPAGDGGFVTTEPVGTMSWMPLNNHPTVKPTYDFSTTTNWDAATGTGRTAISNGRPVGFTDHAADANFPGGSRTWQWKSSEPIANYLVENSVGNYDRDEYLAPSGVLFSHFQASGILPATKATNLATMKMQEDIMNFQTQFNGPFPFNANGVIIGLPTVSFAEEMQTKITFQGGRISLGTLTTRTCTSGGATTSPRTATSGPSSRRATRICPRATTPLAPRRSPQAASVRRPVTRRSRPACRALQHHLQLHQRQQLERRAVEPDEREPVRQPDLHPVGPCLHRAARRSSARRTSTARRRRSRPPTAAARSRSRSRSRSTRSGCRTSRRHAPPSSTSSSSSGGTPRTSVRRRRATSRSSRVRAWPAAASMTPAAAAEITARLPGTGGGTVPATLSLTLGAPATFGAFIPGVAKDYTASTTANVISTAGDAMLTSSDPGHLMNGTFALPSPLEVTFSKSTWTGPTSNESVAIGFKQHIGANDPLRTGTYSKTLTFTLSTTNP